MKHDEIPNWEFMLPEPGWITEVAKIGKPWALAFNIGGYHLFVSLEQLWQLLVFDGIWGLSWIQAWLGKESHEIGTSTSEPTINHQISLNNIREMRHFSGGIHWQVPAGASTDVLRTQEAPWLYACF